MNLPDRIRAAIASAHVRIEQTPFAQQLASGQISPAAYAHSLRYLQSWHDVLEEAFRHAAIAFPPLQSLYRPESMDRTAAIGRDLSALQADPTPLGHAVIDQFTDQVEHWLNQSPWSLIGVLYVIEGSRMGSMVLTRTVAKALQVTPQPGVGLDYHLDGLGTRPADWQKFKGILAQMLLTEDQAEQILQAAVACMEALVELYSGLSVNLSHPQPVTTAG